MLNKGGNAVDAAVAAAFVLGVVDPSHSGLGGGGFALVFDAKSQQTRVLDFREVAPSKASRDMFLKNGKAVPELSRDGALSVAVPGAVAGYFQLLQAFGKLKPSVVLTPAIQAARQGFPVTPNYQRITGKRRSCLVAHSDAARIFLRQSKDGLFDVPPIGTLIRQPDLARTLDLLAKSGPSVFYTGPIARTIATTIKSEGGILSGADLARFKTTWRNPLEGSYRGHRILTMPPPSAGGLAVIQVLGMMELQEPKGFDFHDPDAIHVYAEALRRSFVDRAKFLGDPAFVDIPLQRLSSREYIAQLSSTIDRSKATPSRTLLPTSSRAEASPSGSMNTTHVSILDREGNAVALTTTINYYFGSCLIAKGTGILLNDEMDDFAAAPLAPNVYDLVTGEANAVAPGKIPLSSLSPTFVFQPAAPSRVMIVLGAAGGPTIPSSVVQVISNVIDQHMDLTRAVGQGRIHHQFMPDWIRVDAYGLDPATIKVLEAKGHRVVHEEDWGDLHAVMENPQTHLRYAASDPRYEGMGMGQD
jgi:gamma-glutamyltranspeptidase/glutathione hydrolase